MKQIPPRGHGEIPSGTEGVNQPKSEKINGPKADKLPEDHGPSGEAPKSEGLRPEEPKGGESAIGSDKPVLSHLDIDMEESEEEHEAATSAHHEAHGYEEHGYGEEHSVGHRLRGSVIDDKMRAKIQFMTAVGFEDIGMLKNRQGEVEHRLEQYLKDLKAHEFKIVELLGELRRVERSIQRRLDEGEQGRMIRELPFSLRLRMAQMATISSEETEEEISVSAETKEGHEQPKKKMANFLNFPSERGMESLEQRRNTLITALHHELEAERTVESEAIKFALLYSQADEHAKELIEHFYEIRDYLKLSAELKAQLQQFEKQRGGKLKEQREAFFREKIVNLEKAKNLNAGTQNLIIQFALAMPDINLKPSFFDDKLLIREYLSHMHPNDIDKFHDIASQLMRRKESAEANNETADKIGSFINTITIIFAPAMAIPVVNVIAASIIGVFSAFQFGFGAFGATNDPALGDKWQSRKAKIGGTASGLAILSGVAGIIAIPEIFGEAASGAAAMFQAASVSVFAPLSVGLLIGTLALTTFNAFRDYQAAKETADKHPTEENIVKMKAKRSAVAYNLGVTLVATGLLLTLFFPPSSLVMILGAATLGAASIISYGFTFYYNRAAGKLEQQRIAKEHESELKRTLEHERTHGKTVEKREEPSVLPKNVTELSEELVNKLEEIRIEREKSFEGRPESQPLGIKGEYDLRQLRKLLTKQLPARQSVLGKQGEKTLVPPDSPTMAVPPGSPLGSSPISSPTASRAGGFNMPRALPRSPRTHELPESPAAHQAMLSSFNAKKTANKHADRPVEFEPLAGELIHQEPETPVSELSPPPSALRPATPGTPEESPPHYKTPTGNTPVEENIPARSMTPGRGKNAPAEAEPKVLGEPKPGFTLLHDLELNKLELQKRRAALKPTASKPKASEVEDKAKQGIKPEDIHLDVGPEQSKQKPKETPEGGGGTSLPRRH